MIRPCHQSDFEAIWAIINDGAQAYQGVIPDDCWTEPYMSREELHEQIDAGVAFSGYEMARELVGVMGIQPVQDVTLIRHAYVRTDRQKAGIGGRLLTHLLELAKSPVLIGTWSDAAWAIQFYQKHGFRVVGAEQKSQLLEKYWRIPKRQEEISVVLADTNWWNEPK